METPARRTLRLIALTLNLISMCYWTWALSRNIRSFTLLDPQAGLNAWLPIYALLFLAPTLAVIALLKNPNR